MVFVVYPEAVSGHVCCFGDVDSVLEGVADGFEAVEVGDVPFGFGESVGADNFVSVSVGFFAGIVDRPEGHVA